MKLSRKILLIILVVIMAGTAAYLVWRKWHPAKPPKIWPGYTIKIPSGYTIQGIDVSRYQHHIYWSFVKNMRDQDCRLRFAFIRATQGDAAVDPMFEENWDSCRAYGLMRGAYHFFDPAEDALTQADLFINYVPLVAGDLPPVLDIETDGGLLADTLRGHMFVWLQAVEKYYSIRPVIYCNIDFYRKYLDGYVDEYPLWIAHYYTDRPRIQRDWTFWQHNDRGHVNGIDAFVDFDTFYGDSLAFAHLLYRGK